MSINIERVKSKKAKSGYTYKYRVSYYVNGKRRIKTESGFTSRAKANAAAIEMQAKLLGGYNPQSEKITVGDLWKVYDELEVSQKRIRTQESYRSYYGKHIEPVLGDTAIADLNYSCLQRFFNSLRGYAPSTLNVLKVMLKGIVKIAVRSGYIQNDPLTYVKIASTYQAESKERIISPIQLEEIIRNLSMVRSRAADSYVIAVQIGFYTGLRRGEVLGLHWDDIDLDQACMTIQRQVSRHGVQEALKTRSSRATIPIAAPLVQILRTWKEQNPCHIVCPGIRQTYITPDSLSRVCHEKGFGFHDLRHTFVTTVIKYCDPKTAAALARHSDVQTTLNIYTEVSAERQREVIDAAFPDCSEK